MFLHRLYDGFGGEGANENIDQQGIRIDGDVPSGEYAVFVFADPDGSVGEGRTFADTWGDGLAIDQVGSRKGDIAVITSDGKAVAEVMGTKNTPVRWAIMGIKDE